jgi:hypothetical protein
MRRGVPWRKTWCVYLTLNPVLVRTLMFSNMLCHGEIAPIRPVLHGYSICIYWCKRALIMCKVREPSLFSWFR